MELKSKLLLALSSITSRPSSTTSSIADAIRRATDDRDAPIDDNYVHEILFLVSNSRSSTAFLTRCVSDRIGSAARPLGALKTLLLLHRLLRGGDRRFELDVRDIYASGELRLINNLRHRSLFLRCYAEFMSERTAWAIDQSGRLEPVGPVPVPCRSTDSMKLILWRMSRSQDFLDRVVAFGRKSTVILRPESRVGMAAISIVLKESFRVYTSFTDGVELVLASLADPMSSTVAGVHSTAVREILQRSSSQSRMLSEFYDACKVVIGRKPMEFPRVRIITTAEVSAVEKVLSSSSVQHPPATAVVGGDRNGKLETRISTEWVRFEAYQ